jgi:type I restriction enzyme, S subunit
VKIEDSKTNGKWKTVTLGEVAAVERSGIQPEEIAHGTKYVGLEDIESGGKIRRAKPVDQGELASSKFKFTEKHVLYGKLRPYLAKISCPDFSGICSTDILPILPGPQLDRWFLCYFLRQPSLVAYASSRAVGINLPRVPYSILAQIELPLPPLHEQRRIAAVLDRAEAARDKRRTTLNQFDSLTQSIFLDLFGDPTTNAKGWPVKQLEELCNSITDIDHKMPKSVQEGFPFISAKDLTEDGRISFEQVKRIAEEDFKRLSRKSKPEKGDIIYSRIGVNLGKARIVEVDSPFLASYSCCTIKPLSEVVDASYLCALLDSPFMLRQAHKGVRAIAVPDLGIGEIKAFKIILPPIALQREFARRVTAVEKLKATQRQSLAQMDALFASLQRRAFQGQL